MITDYERSKRMVLCNNYDCPHKGTCARQQWSFPNKRDTVVYFTYYKRLFKKKKCRNYISTMKG